MFATVTNCSVSFFLNLMYVTLGHPSQKNKSLDMYFFTQMCRPIVCEVKYFFVWRVDFFPLQILSFLN